MPHRQQVETYSASGFLRGTRVIDDEQVGVLQEEIARVIADQGKPDLPQPVLLRNLSGRREAAVWQIVNIWQASEPFRALVNHQDIVETDARLAGAKQLRLFHDQIQYKPAGQGGVNMWHQDSPYWPILSPKDAMITAWVALDDVDEGNGCMRMVPGSHLWGDQIDFLHTLNDFDSMPREFRRHRVEVVSCPVARGEVHFHHPLTWHGSGPNRSGRPRRAIALHYMTERCRYVAAGEHPMKPFIEAGDGEVVRGAAFPVVWEQTSR